jgi:two-component system OmpR family sensor kinase
VTLTLRARLAAISAIVFGLLLAALSILSYGVLARRLDSDVTERLVQLTDGLHGYLRFDGGVASLAFDAADSDQAAFVHEATRYYQIYDLATGRLVVESNGLAPLGLHLTSAEVGAFRARPKPFDIATEYGRLRISNSVRTVSDGQAYLLQVGVSLAAMDGALRRYRGLLLWYAPAALLIAMFAAWWLSGFALVPLSRMADEARLIDVKTLERRLRVRGVDDELDRVALAFNDTLARLEAAVGQMRQFSAALAHELRTPLTVLRGEIELALRKAGTDNAQHRTAASQIEEIDRLTRLIDHILTLARAESGQIHLTIAPVNMGDLAASLVDQLEPVAQARSIDLRCERSEAVVVQGDAGWLQRLLLNLLDNALKFTGQNGRIVVRVSREGDTARIDVEDSGIGLSSEDAEQVFERFFRADPARSSATEGAGLGLSLVQWIAESHRGAVAVRSRLNEGSTFTVTIPLSATSFRLKAEASKVVLELPH